MKTSVLELFLWPNPQLCDLSLGPNLQRMNCLLLVSLLVLLFTLGISVAAAPHRGNVAALPLDLRFLRFSY